MADSNISNNEKANQVLAFWLKAGPSAWWRKDDEFDAQIKEQFGDLLELAAAGELDNWRHEASSCLAKADRNELTNHPCTTNQMTLGALVELYLKEITPKKAGVDTECIVLKAFLRHPICAKPLSKIRAKDFAAYRDDRLEQVKPQTLKRQLSPLHHMFEVARDEWGIPLAENPLDKLRLKFVDQRRERRLKEGELDRIIRQARKCRSPYVVPVILFAVETAMRRGEILGMKWSDLDAAEKSLRIPHSKNGYSRCIPLSSKALAVLEALQPVSERVFPITANAFRLAWERVKKRAGIVDLHFHDLRHEAISRFFELGLTVPEVGLISGHRDTRMLLRYAHGDSKLVRQKLDLCGQTTQPKKFNLFTYAGKSERAKKFENAGAIIHH